MVSAEACTLFLFTFGFWFFNDNAGNLSKLWCQKVLQLVHTNRFKPVCCECNIIIVVRFPAPQILYVIDFEAASSYKSK